MATVFTQIIEGKLPSYKLYEDDLTASFLTLDQIRPGHSLIVPKKEVDYFLDLPEPYYSRVFENAKIIGRAIQNATGCRRVGTAILGFEVPHFHYHLIPMESMKDIDFSRARQLPESEMAALQESIRAELEKLQVI